MIIGVEKLKRSVFLEFVIYCSAPHTLLVMGKVDPLHPDLLVDPLGILRPQTKLTHQLPLVTFLFFPSVHRLCYLSCGSLIRKVVSGECLLIFCETGNGSWTGTTQEENGS